MTTQAASSRGRLRLGPADFGASAAEWNAWEWQYTHCLHRPAHLERIPWLARDEVDRMAGIARTYPFVVTPYFLSLIRWDDPEDPVRIQVLPDPAEIRSSDSGSLDPLCEHSHTVASGLIHRYRDRAVVLATHRCAVHCRHCFRKRLWKGKPPEDDDRRWTKVIDYLERHEEVRDVLLSGGDPLILPDHRLEEILARIRKVRHVEIVRIGSRVPVAMPQRVTPGLCQILEKHGPLWLVTQFNHPREITPEAARACERILRSGVPVNNQTVLLRRVNDRVETMRNLCRGLLRIRVRPYYLHQCDPVAGTGHFRTPLSRGVEILSGLQGTTTGLAVPRFMVDLPGRGGKVSLQADSFVSREGTRVFLRNHAGEIFSYEDPDDEESALGGCGIPSHLAASLRRA